MMNAEFRDIHHSSFIIHHSSFIIHHSTVTANSQIYVEMSSDEAKVWQSILKMSGGLKEVEAGYKKVGKASQDAGKEQDALGRAAKKVWEDCATPMERHKQRVLELNVLLKKGLIDQEAYGKAVRQSQESVDKMAQSHSAAANWAGHQLGAIKAMALSYLTVETAIHAVTAAIEHKEQVERRAKDVTITSADAQMGMLRNLGDVTEKEQNEFDAELRGLNARYKPKGGMAAVYAEAASGLSASQSNRPATLAAMDAAMRFAPDSAETREQIAGAILDLRKATKNEDPIANLGLLKVIGEQSRLTDWAKIAKNLSGGVIGVKEYGGNAQQAGALIAAITQASADVEGRRSTNAAIGMVEQLERYLPQKDKFDYRLDPKTMRMKKIVLAKGTGMTDWMSRIEYLRANPEEMDRVLGDLSAEKKQKAAIRQIIMGQGTGFDALQSAMKEMNIPLAEMKSRAETKIDLMQKPFGQQVADLDRNSQATEGQLINTILGKEAQLEGLFSKEAVYKVLDASGGRAGVIDPLARSVVWNVGALFGRSNRAAYGEQIRHRVADLVPSMQPEQYDDFLDNPGGRTPAQQQFADEHPENIQVAQALMEHLKTQNAKADKMVEELEGMRRDLQHSQKTPSSAAVQNGRDQHGEKK